MVSPFFTPWSDSGGKWTIIVPSVVLT